MFEIKTQQYVGPLDKLLELIEERKLEITQISLADVTASFLDYVKKLGESVAPGVLADFVVVATRLILIKSKVLLPEFQLTEEEEADIKDLEGRLKIYKEFKRASQFVSALWLDNHQSFSRQFLMNLGDAAVFYPPKKLIVDDLINAARRLLISLKSWIPEAVTTVKEVIVTIEDKMKELVSRFQEAAEHSFGSLAGGKSKREIIIAFLAILHLLKDQLVQAEQKGQFGDIIIKKPAIDN